METLVSNLNGRSWSVTIDGRKFLVASATALPLPGVLPGSKGPLFYPSDETTKSIKSWDGKPLTLNHPSKDGAFIAANSAPDFQIGHIRKPTIHRGKLRFETWFDEELTANKAPELLKAIKAGQKVEVSTGLVVDVENVNGTCPVTGKAYTGIARNYRPDHLAVLPNTPGACSVQDGCGIHNAKKSTTGGRWVTTKAGRHLFLTDKGTLHLRPGGKSVIAKEKGKPTPKDELAKTPKLTTKQLTKAATDSFRRAMEADKAGDKETAKTLRTAGYGYNKAAKHLDDGDKNSAKIALKAAHGLETGKIKRVTNSIVVNELVTNATVYSSQETDPGKGNRLEPIRVGNTTLYMVVNDEDPTPEMVANLWSQAARAAAALARKLHRRAMRTAGGRALKTAGKAVAGKIREGKDKIKEGTKAVKDGVKSIGHDVKQTYRDAKAIKRNLERKLDRFARSEGVKGKPKRAKRVANETVIDTMETNMDKCPECKGPMKDGSCEKHDKPKVTTNTAGGCGCGGVTNAPTETTIMNLKEWEAAAPVEGATLLANLRAKAEAWDRHETARKEELVKKLTANTADPVAKAALATAYSTMAVNHLEVLASQVQGTPPQGGSGLAPVQGQVANLGILPGLTAPGQQPVYLPQGVANSGQSVQVTNLEMPVIDWNAKS